MTRFNFPIGAILIATLLISGCRTTKEETVSPTVNPGDTSVGQGSSGSNAAAPSPSRGVQTTYSGLQYEVIRQGTGKRPSTFNKVKVHYHGTLTNGTVFDSSVQRGQPATFGVGQVIPGWTEGLQLMQEGAKYRFTIPPNLAYGPRGAPPKIGPNETLIFDVELLEVLY
ncbi:FKBP-type peptidyl-prolyl cis-trans isomerase [Verrucomicrobiales bacterium BCK34]|nr:FKBP-type peptidyl-prolyl cis-trans isomerase [Verrucomicrobiales bacterium BCK34]